MLRATLWRWNQPFRCFGFFYWSFPFCSLFYFPAFLSCGFVPSRWVSSFISAMNLQVCISILFLYWLFRLNGKIRNRIQPNPWFHQPWKPYFILPLERVSLSSATHFFKRGSSLRTPEVWAVALASTVRGITSPRVKHVLHVVNTGFGRLIFWLRARF